MRKKQLTDHIEWNKVWNIPNQFQIILGIIFAVLAMKGFLIPNRFLDGGITGLEWYLHISGIQMDWQNLCCPYSNRSHSIINRFTVC